MNTVNRSFDDSLRKYLKVNRVNKFLNLKVKTYEFVLQKMSYKFVN